VVLPADVTRRTRTRRRLALLAIVALLSILIVVVVGSSGGGGGNPAHGSRPGGSAHASARQQIPADAVDCVPRSTIDSLGPDGLPPATGPLGDGLVTSREENEQLIRMYARRIEREYPGIVALGTGAGWRRAWTSTNGVIDVVPVHDYAIVATVRRAAQCPAIPGFAAGLGRATIFFRHL
jgi:hypothetical protein